MKKSTACLEPHHLNNVTLVEDKIGCGNLNRTGIIVQETSFKCEEKLLNDCMDNEESKKDPLPECSHMALLSWV